MRTALSRSHPAAPRARNAAGEEGAAQETDASLLRGGGEMRFASTHAEAGDGSDVSDPDSTTKGSDSGASKVGPPVGYNKYSRPMDKTPMTVLVDFRIFNMVRRCAVGRPVPARGSPAVSTRVRSTT